MDLAGKVAIVTGGAGGLGVAVVERLLGAGAAVITPYVDETAFARLHECCPAAIGVRVDLTDEAAAKAAYDAIAATHGGIDILVNSAGGFAGGEPVHQTPWSLWQSQLDINLKTAVISCAAAIPHMIARGGGAIVNVSSRTATQAGANLAAYAAAKRAVLQLTEALAAELLPHDITVNAVLPSVIDTPANRAAMPNAKHDRWVKPSEIAAVIHFLVGPAARIISGAAIPVYGKA
ncbi:short-chain dehydrogenase [Chloroflexus islandicus]|uniref:Short-chain dehydrogenase n=1 Tax=Chloroflexus islandicus TaxID=1707952 RepID=A0A178MG78_9CHLR|nr:SDR family NAD(P)-dependent oxidoreductase [Chloroflexus islandicus]OAN47712.1 short-chain dehydrogenase [Chloroflexus islandicus]